ncbi:MAG: hypothetical protein LBU76_11595 [Azoarcus sp.]|jgi:uncharacterized membrane protein YobD (UPF0266 family)|nr:hypothetical protein [Azoarcus sp.]
MNKLKGILKTVDGFSAMFWIVFCVLLLIPYFVEEGFILKRVLITIFFSMLIYIFYIRYRKFDFQGKPQTSRVAAVIVNILGAWVTYLMLQHWFP